MLHDGPILVVEYKDDRSELPRLMPRVLASGKGCADAISSVARSERIGIIVGLVSMRLFVTMLALTLAATPALSDSLNKEQAPLARPVDRTAWIKSVDYPLESWLAEESGTVGLVATVNEAGRVIDCKVTQSSNYKALDQASCELYERRGTFEPARDAKGQYVVSNYPDRIRWMLPAGYKPMIASKPSAAPAFSHPAALDSWECMFTVRYLGIYYQGTPYENWYALAYVYFLGRLTALSREGKKWREDPIVMQLASFQEFSALRSKCEAEVSALVIDRETPPALPRPEADAPHH